MKQLLSYCPSSSAEFEEKSYDQVIYTKVDFCSSSSDEECESSFITKLQTKKLIFNKSSTSSVESLQQKEEPSTGDVEMIINRNKTNDIELFEDNIKKTQKKKRRKQVQRHISLPKEIMSDKTLMKYWFKRYKLFSKFDEGIRLDRGMSIEHLLFNKYLSINCFLFFLHILSLLIICYMI